MEPTAMLLNIVIAVLVLDQIEAAPELQIDLILKTVDTKLGQYQQKIDAIDHKINKMTNFLDENHLLKKIELLYDGVSHRLNNLERKLDVGLQKLQSKIDKMDENFSKRHDDVQVEIAETIAALDDLNLKLPPDDENPPMKEFTNDLKTELNEYAIKVAEMNSDNWKTSNDIMENQQILNDKLDENFEKLLSAQHLFIESCYRLQKDESQIEVKISEILEALMKTFQEKTSVQSKDVHNLEKLIKTHDSHLSRFLIPTANRINSIDEKISRSGRKIDSDLRKIINQIYELQIRGNNDQISVISLIDEHSNNLTSQIQKFGRKLDDIRNTTQAQSIDDVISDIFNPNSMIPTERIEPPQNYFGLDVSSEVDVDDKCQLTEENSTLADEENNTEITTSSQ